MHYTLHLTNGCNMNCKYCYVDHNNTQYMSLETAKQVVDLASFNARAPVGIIFFGGEPILCKEVIYETIDYCRWKEKREGKTYYFKITTNGLLLDENFMEQSIKEDIFIALSHDGIEAAHNKNRIDKNGQGTFTALSPKIDLLLAKRPYSPVMMVVNPDTVEHYSASVRYLYNRGFRYIICSLNYAGSWDDAHMKILRRQYERLADFYYERTMLEDKFYLSPFEVKISSHVNKNNYCHERCELGKKQISAAPNGDLYPCVQFVGKSNYSIGHASMGINYEKQLDLYELNEVEKESCKDCELSSRCNHYCGCMNMQTTGSINKVSPVQCAHERILIPIVDKLAQKLYKKRNAMFIQKHYNEMFPLISLIEDRTVKSSEYLYTK